MFKEFGHIIGYYFRYNLKYMIILTVSLQGNILDSLIGPSVKLSVEFFKIFLFLLKQLLGT